LILKVFFQHDVQDGTDPKNKKDKKKKKKKESDDEAEKQEKSPASGESTKAVESSLRQRKGDEVVTAQKDKETDKDEPEETKK
jgi:hypothetical protein